MIQKPLTFDQEFSIGFVLGQLFHSVFAIFFICMVGMIITYIGQIRGKTVRLMEENISLFDRMHEGLIVISEKDLSLQFASRPAVALLK